MVDVVVDEGGGTVEPGTVLVVVGTVAPHPSAQVRNAALHAFAPSAAAHPFTQSEKSGPLFSLHTFMQALTASAFAREHSPSS